MPTKIYAGARLRELRQRLMLSQAEFAQRLGVSIPYLSQMENNHLFKTYDMLRLAQVPVK